MSDLFEISKHIVVEFQTAGLITHPFVIGTSLIGGTDVLDTSDYEPTEWTDFACEVYQVDVDAGVNLDMNVVTQESPGTAMMSFRGAQLDPAQNSLIGINVPVRIKVIPEPDTAPTTYGYLFFGYIDSINVRYDDQGKTYVDISATDFLGKLMNVEQKSYQFLPYYPPFKELSGGRWSNLMVTAAAIYPSATFTVSEYCKTYMSNDDTPDPQNLGLYISDIVNTEGGFIRLSRSEAAVQFVGRDFYPTFEYEHSDNITAASDFGFSNVHSDSADHWCLTDCQMTYDLTTPNKLRVQLTGDATIYSETSDPSSISRYGEIAEVWEINAYDQTDVDLMTTDVNVTADNNRVKSVSTDMIRSDGKLRSCWSLEPVISAVRVYMNFSPTPLNQSYRVARVRHAITSDSWDASYELWRSFFG